MNISMYEVSTVGDNRFKAKLMVGENAIETEISVRKASGALIFDFRDEVFNAIMDRAFINNEICADLARFIEGNGRALPWEYGDINYPIFIREVAKQFPERGVGITAVENDHTEMQKQVQALNGATP